MQYSQFSLSSRCLPSRKLLITLHPGIEPPSHGNAVVGLFKAEGDAQACWFENEDWHCTDNGGEAETPEFWFEVPSVEKLKTDAMLTAVSEYEFDRLGDEGASVFS